MKKQLGILLIVLLVTIGLSDAVAAYPVANVVSSGTVINSPGAIVGGNVVSVTGGDTTSAIWSTTYKSTTNIGVGAYRGNTVI